MASIALPFMVMPYATKSMLSLFNRSDFTHLQYNVKLRLSRTSHYIYPEVRKLQSKRVVAGPISAVRDNKKKEEENEDIEAVLRLTALVSVRFNKMDLMKGLIQHTWLHVLHHAHQSPKGVVLQLVSNEIDSKTKKPKVSEEVTIDWSANLSVGTERVTQKVEFSIDSKFGVPGAIIVKNTHRTEFYLENIIIEGFTHFSCNSWVQPIWANGPDRIFFSEKMYLPGETPVGLQELRKRDLQQLRGNGEDQMTYSDRIYDYDVYNDLGNPDKGIEYVRATLGGTQKPHPRHCRTGRASTITVNENAESPVQEFMPIYVPREEEMEWPRREALELAKRKGVLRNMIPFLRAKFGNDGHCLDIDMLYKNKKGFLSNNFPVLDILSNFKQSIDDNFKFDRPSIFSGLGDDSCIRDDELGRQMLAGSNPLSIKRLTTFPPKSKLDPAIYGPMESALKEEHLLGHLDGMSVQQALQDNKLFILDYHDIYLPFLKDINAQGDRKAHATRSIFFLTPLGTLKPIAIELSRPHEDSGSFSKQVLTPPVDATTYWLWQLGKAHVCSNDTGANQLIHHWLRCHACMEPFIIAAHRQLSKRHPIFKLLAPHMRHTLKINASARESLINAGGLIESNFSPGKHSMEIASVAYRDWWRFDMEGLPADLVRRGLAIRDETQPHGIRLLIEDYPYASDGLLIWSAIEKLVRTYVNYYYPKESLVISDAELQCWYSESIDVGHADLKNGSWWPQLKTPNDLASIITTIIWITTAHHSAVNYGQYPFGGHVPSQPPLLRRLVPTQNNQEYADFIKAPQEYFISSLPSLFESTKFMAVLEILSSHWPDEEYLGERRDLATWSKDPQIIEAFNDFSIEIRKIQKEIEKRNLNPTLRNRCGAGVAPYELLMPCSRIGNTGVPNSIAM